MSNGVAAGVTVGGNYGKGYGNGDETTYVASHVGDVNSQTTVMAGGDANLIGSQLKGKQIQLEAQNLNIESLQDKSTYKGKQMNVAGSVTVGYGFAASGSYSQSKINADHASVNEQAGIYAGDDGYNINVNRHTELKGAIITSTQQAEDNGKNQFTTGSLTHSDIENHSNYSGSSFGVSGGVSMNFDTPFGKDGAQQSSKQATDEKGNPLYTDSQGNTTVSATDANGKENKAKAAEGLASVQTNYGMGYGSDKDSQSSTTKSGINTQNIRIKDEAEQLKRTGKTAQETIAAIKTDITTDNAEAQSGKLENHFDKDKVQKELDLQREVTESFGQTVTQTSAMIAEKMSEESCKKKYEAAVELENAKKAREENDSEINRTWEEQAQANFDTANREAKEWETGGSQRRVIDTALNILTTVLAGRPAAEVVASGLSPAINHQIKEMTTDKDGNVNTPVNLMAHAIWGGIEAYAGNRNAAAGATGAVAGEAAAGIISQILYDKSPDKLTQDEKLTVSTLSQAAASIAGGTLANNADGAIIAAKTAKDAVENNYLSNFDVENLVRELDKAQKEGRDTKPILEKYKGISEKNRQELIACNGNVVCETAHLYEMNTGVEELDRNLGFFSKMTVYYPNDLNTENRIALSKFVDSENAKSFDKLSNATKFGLTAMEAGGAIGLGAGVAYAKIKLPKGVSANEKLPVVGETKGYALKSFNYEAHNLVNYEKYKQQLVKQNLENLAKQYPELSHAALGKNNFTYQDKTLSREESNELGKAWVGPNYKTTSQGGFVSEDGARVYRPPTKKVHSNYAKTGEQSNFERGYIDPETKKFISESNLHINIEKRK